ncbi:Rgl1p KNAG_0A02040 [Huiozyma naganishii CBS 8797]|uniref:Arrestin-like N-terminal domain-containing protein n=1 Tax=Huiozyma naganishii (strain ATCC MYA-139 / BCRC 22969 / CBS 8797 / KCTC 17520 / NBRC 10181 / NCYC 3082 / Yp74L-3) TaxID=1071383 RepID=J7REB2_HUIN7|nr:hypothetical protein KNAG_0A02040 [Kazachstania naganishii CBS 8797]CCK67893.1 hypothetical protein KNAG_0A02040 [Kazachstania naganishii CBS 8797]
MAATPVISLKPSYNSVVRGCPGLPDTLPRVECQVQVRSGNGEPFQLDKMEIRFFTVESLHGKNRTHRPNSHLGVDSTMGRDTEESLISGLAKRRKNKLDHITVHYQKTISLKKDSTQKQKPLLAVDMPLTIALPDDIKETNYNTTFGSCYHMLDCTVYYNGKHSKNFKHVINVERYTYLPNPKLFAPLERTSLSADGKFKVSYKVENPCVSSEDLLKLTVTFRPNLLGDFGTGNQSPTKKGLLFNKRIKLKHIDFQLREVLEINDASKMNFTATDSFENVLHTQIEKLNQIVSMNDIKVVANVRILTRDRYFQNFESTFHEPAFVYKLGDGVPQDATTTPREIKTVLLQNKNNNVPLQYHTSITTFGRQFNITHNLHVGFKISNGKDFAHRLNVTVTPWTAPQLRDIAQLISQERETAAYAKRFYKSFGGIVIRKSQGDYYLEYPVLPPMVSHHDESTMEQFCIKYDTNHTIPRRVPIIE